jgi:hypothetical protein
VVLLPFIQVMAARYELVGLNTAKGAHVTSIPGASYGIGNDSPSLLGSSTLPYPVTPLSPLASPIIPLPDGLVSLVGLPDPGLTIPGVPTLVVRSAAERRCLPKTLAFSSSGTSTRFEKLESFFLGVDWPEIVRLLSGRRDVEPLRDIECSMGGVCEGEEPSWAVNADEACCGFGSFLSTTKASVEGLGVRLFEGDRVCREKLAD